MLNRFSIKTEKDSAKSEKVTSIILFVWIERHFIVIQLLVINETEIDAQQNYFENQNQLCWIFYTRMLNRFSKHKAKS